MGDAGQLLQATSYDCDMHYCGLAIERSEGHHRLMSCTKSYGKSGIELLIRTTSFKKIWRAGKYPRLTKIQLKLIPVFHYTIPFHCSIPLIPDSLAQPAFTIDGDLTHSTGYVLSAWALQFMFDKLYSWQKSHMGWVGLS